MDSDSEITFRPATLADKPRILEIAAQVWEGHDYIPAVIDEWLAATTAELVAAWLGGELVGFARYDRLFPSYAWFEGLRSDPAWRNRGIGRALTRHLLARAQGQGARRVGLSTYMDNLASRHIIESYGLAPVASFIYCEAEAPVQAQSSSRAVGVDPAEALAFIGRSRFLEFGRGFFPHGWRFYPYALDPQLALGQMRHLLGVHRAGQLAALLCIGRPTHGPDTFSIDFLDGEPDAMVELARHAFHLAGSASHIEAMVPGDAESVAPALAVLRDLGLSVWNDGQADVFVYERSLPWWTKDPRLHPGSHS